MAEHERLVQRLAIRIYFADPYSPGNAARTITLTDCCVNTCPGADLSRYTQRELNALVHRLNAHPRKCLNFAAPLEIFTPLRHDSPVAIRT